MGHVQGPLSQKFAMKDSNIVIMKELRTFKMTGSIKKYIAVYEDLHDQAPYAINFDEALPQLDFYNGLPKHIRRQFEMTHFKNLQDVFLEGKHTSQNSDNLHATNKQKRVIQPRRTLAVMNDISILVLKPKSQTPVP
ncbi:hypothetical protein DSO57_1020402 [Entomophthora muscae]|uniref:Uncharacterized protein n=1 Tax=Entomophthora muscae TaxID=34485 RepID=A0ACC2RIH2_9FUNG|nr:hypothetical protein DSO57_1020402 [Entomophthora muscae]